MAEKKEFSLGQHVPRILVRRQISAGASSHPQCSPASPILKVSFNGQTFDLPRDGSIHVKKLPNSSPGEGSVVMASKGSSHSSVIHNTDGSTRIHFENRGNKMATPLVRTGSGTNVSYKIPIKHHDNEKQTVTTQRQEASSSASSEGCRDSGYSSAFADFEKMFEKFSDDSKQSYILTISSPSNSPQSTRKTDAVKKATGKGGRLFSDDYLEEDCGMTHTEKLRVLKERLQKLKSQFHTELDGESTDEPSIDYCKYMHDGIGDLELDLDLNEGRTNSSAFDCIASACEENISLDNRRRNRTLLKPFRKSKSEEDTLCSRLHDDVSEDMADFSWYRTAPPGSIKNSGDKACGSDTYHCTDLKADMTPSEHSAVLVPDKQVQFDKDKFAALKKKAEHLKLDEQELDEMFLNKWCDDLLTARGEQTDDEPYNSKVSTSKLSSSADEDENSNTTGYLTDSCADCGYTCHHKCQKSVTLDCSGSAGSLPPEEETALHDPPDEKDRLAVSHTDKCETDSGYSGSGGKGERTLTRDDLKRSIWLFNERFPNLGMTMPDDENTFHGFIHVNMNLSRPINMRVSPRPPSIYDIMQHELAEEDFKTKILSFYLPKDTLKALHISSCTTAQEVIEVLLNKFKITDNPRKFALYEQTLEKSSEVRLRKILDSEHPLMLCLNWGHEVSGHKRFVLQENETGEIMWEAFSIPELQNFLKILELEETECVKEIKNKYMIQRKHMQELMSEYEQKQDKKERT